MVADDLVKQGARASAAMVLTKLLWNIIRRVDKNKVIYNVIFQVN